MHLKFCTVTGADDNTPINEMLRISEKFPFVEWGILFGWQGGCPRFPAPTWVSALMDAAERHKELNLCAHLCGIYLRQMLLGKQVMPACFARIQLNWHGQSHWTVETPAMHAQMLMEKQRQFIFQLDGVNDAHLQAAIAAGVNAAGIFDRSHGAGVLPETWPEPIPKVLCTYSGGLGPGNLYEQLCRIDEITDAEICVDMETRVRGRDERGADVLDLAKVELCLDLAREFVPF